MISTRKNLSPGVQLASSTKQLSEQTGWIMLFPEIALIPYLIINLLLLTRLAVSVINSCIRLFLSFFLLLRAWQ